MGINDKSEVVGQTEAPNGFDYLAFLWRDGRMISLGTLNGGTRSTANGINNRSQIVGYSYVADGSTHACLWEHEKPIDLNSLIPSGSGWILTYANAVNEHGQIVGVGTHDGHTRAFLLTHGGHSERDAESSDQ
jgi:probable HAF family extracellular repeat protein